MSDVKQFRVGMVKSVTYDAVKRQLRGIIETVNDKEHPELPFIVTDSLMNIEKGKMVKFVKKTSPITSRATDITEI